MKNIWRLMIALVAVAGLALAAFIPMHSAASSAAIPGISPQQAKELKNSLIHGGDADAMTASRPKKGVEGPISSAIGLENYQRAFPAKQIPADAEANGTAQANLTTDYTYALGWHELGPSYAPNANDPNPNTGAASPVSGRISALAVDPTTCASGSCNTIYVGAANGGVWKTINGGQTWTPLFDHQLTTAIGTITLDPKNPNIVYVGTGEPNSSCDSQHGMGVYKSTNAGASWTRLGATQFTNRSIGSLLIDPRTAGTANETLYVVDYSGIGNNSTTESCTADIPSQYLPTRGFFVSKDGGNTWTLSNPDNNGVYRGQSLVMDPSNPNVLYVGFLSRGIYKSTNDGQTWTQQTAGLPSSGFDRITLAIAQSSPQTLYAAYDLNGAEAMYKTLNGGTSWAQLSNTPDACDGQCWYDMPLAVDPTNANVVYAGGSANYDYLFAENPACYTLNPLAKSCNAQVMKTTDGGNTWADVGENGSGAPLHPDDHIILISPTDHNVVFTGNDGGLFHSANGGTSWNDLNKGLATLQFQGVAVAPNGWAYGGTQDNGTFRIDPSNTSSAAHIQGGDGGASAADPTNSNIAYSTFYGAQTERTDDGGNSQTWIASFFCDFFCYGGGQFYEPVTVAPSAPNNVFDGTFRVWHSAIRGGVDGNHDGDATNDPSDKTDWTPISFDLSCGAQPADPTTMCGGGIASMAVSPVDPNVMVVGTSNGYIWLTKNALAPVTVQGDCNPLHNQYDTSSLCWYKSGPTWTRIDSALPHRFPTSIAFMPGSSTSFYVTYSGFDETTPTTPGHIFKTADSGATWTNLNGTGSTSLPDLPFNSIAVNPNNSSHLYAAADFGVFMSLDGGATWRRTDFAIPNTPVYQLAFRPGVSQLYAATHGRGIWMASVP